MAIVAQIRKARKQIRVRGGIPLILDVMDIPDYILRTSYNDLSDANRELIAVAIACAKVLDSLSSSPKVREELRKHGVVRHMERFLKSLHTALVIPIMGTVQQCASMAIFRKALENTDIVYDVVRHLQSDNTKLKENCALAIFKCGPNKVARDMIRNASGLDLLCKLLKTEEVRSNKRLLAAVTGGIWKCAISPENVVRFNQLNVVASLVPFLEEHEDEEVQANVVGALAECCKDPLLENVPLVIKECAQNEQCMDIINDPEHIHDGVRLVWSLLKHPSDRIKRNSCLALVPCIKYAKDSPEMVRAFVGGLELTVSLLRSTNTEVLSATCATIAEIATDPENLGILSDHGVVEKLAKLVSTHVLRLVGSDDPEMQIAAASTIRNIRKLALTAEKLQFKEISTLEETDYHR